jgi:hypothetical protein
MREIFFPFVYVILIWYPQEKKREKGEHFKTEWAFCFLRHIPTAEENLLLRTRTPETLQTSLTGFILVLSNLPLTRGLLQLVSPITL